MKLRSVHMRNFRCFDDVTIDFNDKLTVLIGENGAGKSSILDAIIINLFSLKNLLPTMDGARVIGEDEIRKTNPSWRIIDLDTEQGGHTASAFPYSIKQSYLEKYFPAPPEPTSESLLQFINGLIYEVRQNKEVALPVFRIYSVARGRKIDPNVSRESLKEHPRLQPYATAFDMFWEFKEFVLWFYDKEFQLLSNLRKDKDFVLPDLKAVKDALEMCLPGYTDPRIDADDIGKEFVMTDKASGLDMPVGLFSSGYAAIISIVADLAYRMAQINPHLKNPLESEGVVLIDEIDLSLHPRWQQRVLEDLQRAFPNTQFIVTTHSPLVLTTVRPENIVYLENVDGHAVPHYGEEMGISTYGADAMRVMQYYMDVFTRPPRVKEKLDTYFSLIDQGQGDSERAGALRSELQELLRDDPVFYSADRLLAAKKRFS